MSGPQRNADKVNTIGIVVVGICGAVLVYVSIVALQAFYMADTSEVNTMAEYGGQDLTARSIRSEQQSSIGTYGWNTAVDLQNQQTARVGIDHAMELVARDIAASPKNAGNLVPSQGRSDTATIPPSYGRPVMGGAASATGAGSAAAGSADAGSAAAGSAAVVPTMTVPMTPTGGAAQGGGPPPGSSPNGTNPSPGTLSKPSDQQPGNAGSGK